MSVRTVVFVGGVVVLAVTGWILAPRLGFFQSHQVGEPVDTLNGVVVYYNGTVGNVEGRNTAPGGYNLGLKYQCVEFVKRYYYERLDHAMPDSWGHARDFFEVGLADGAHNSRRNLAQYRNPSRSRPQPDDLLVFGPTRFNPYGHVAIVTHVDDHAIELTQQNPGPRARSRVRRMLEKRGDKWIVDDEYLRGWLRKE